MFWDDKIVKLLIGVGMVIVACFFLATAAVHVSSVQTTLNITVSTQGGAGSLFIYPILSSLVFIGAINLGRSLYYENRSIAYRLLIASHSFNLVWITLAIWSVRLS